VVPVVQGIVPVIVYVPLYVAPAPLIVTDSPTVKIPGLATTTLATLEDKEVATTGAESNHKKPLIKSSAVWQVSSIHV
jgi:hypothetical protein